MTLVKVTGEIGDILYNCSHKWQCLVGLRHREKSFALLANLRSHWYYLPSRSCRKRRFVVTPRFEKPPAWFLAPSSSYSNLSASWPSPCMNQLVSLATPLAAFTLSIG